MTSQQANEAYVSGQIGFNGWLNLQADFAPHSGRDTGMYAKKKKRKAKKK